MTATPNVNKTLEIFKESKQQTASFLMASFLDNCATIHPVTEFQSIINVDDWKKALLESAEKEGPLDSAMFQECLTEYARSIGVPEVDANLMAHILFDLGQESYDPILTQFGRASKDFVELLEPLDAVVEVEPVEGSLEVTQSDADKMFPNMPASANYGYNLCERLLKFGGDVVVGMEDDSKRMQEVLLRKIKNNPIILGDSGVGKTSLVQFLAQEILGNTCNPFLTGTSIIVIDIVNLISGTKFRGEFEERITSVLNEASETSRVILFFDDIHLICAKNDDSPNVASVIKPYLKSGAISCIGATTHEDYQKSIEKDPVLSRLFEPVALKEPSKEQTLKIMESVKDSYSEFHKINFTTRALKQIIDLTDLHVPAKHFPDKALDAMDGLGSFVKQKKIHPPKRAREIDDEFNELRDKAREENMEESLEACEKLVKEYDKVMSTWSDSLTDMRIPISKEDITQFFHKKYGVEVDALNVRGRKKLMALRENIAKNIFGQDPAIDKVCHQLQVSEFGLRGKDLPKASFLFCGSSGVGKTEMAKQLSRYYFGHENILMYNMSEFNDKISANKLIGSSPGYVGYDEGGRLVNEIRKNPSSVVLFDEVEKAHEDVLDVFLQVLDEANIADSNGRKGDFRKSIVVFTTNVKPETEQRELGFGASSEAAVDFSGPLRNKFKQEFLNRINEIVVFNDISKEVASKIVDKEISQIQERLKASKVSLVVEPDVKELIMNRESSTQDGARNIRNSVEQVILSPLTNFLLENPDKKLLVAKSKNGGAIVCENTLED